MLEEEEYRRGNRNMSEKEIVDQSKMPITVSRWTYMVGLTEGK